MGRVGRDWRAYGMFRRDEETLFLRKARAVVWGMPPPWEPGGGRPPSYNPRALVVCLLLMRELRKSVNISFIGGAMLKGIGFYGLSLRMHHGFSARIDGC